MKPAATAAEPALAHLQRVDKRLGRIIERVGPLGLALLPPDRAPGLMQVSPFAALARSVIYQQLNGKAAAVILGRVKALYGFGPEDIAGFPDPQALLATADEPLRAAGLSRAKLLAIRGLAEATQNGILPTRDVIASLNDEAIVTQLTTLRGIGRWTVEILLMFHLGRPDVLPATDFGVRKGFQIVYRKKEMPAPREVLAFGERWRPWRSAAAWYLWRATEL